MPSSNPTKQLLTYQVEDLTKVNLDCAALKILGTLGVVNQLRELALTHFVGSVSKDEQQGVDNVTLSTSVRTDDGGEGFVEGSDLLSPSIGLEVDEHHLFDDKAGR